MFTNGLTERMLLLDFAQEMRISSFDSDDNIKRESTLEDQRGIAMSLLN